MEKIGLWQQTDKLDVFDRKASFVMYFTDHAKERLIERYPKKMQDVPPKHISTMYEKGDYIFNGKVTNGIRILVRYKYRWFFVIYNPEQKLVVTFLKKRKKIRRFLDKVRTAHEKYNKR